MIRFDPTELGEATSRTANEPRATRRQPDRRSKQVRQRGELEQPRARRAMAGMELDSARQFQSKDAEIFSRSEIIESEIDGAGRRARRSTPQRCAGSASSWRRPSSRCWRSSAARPSSRSTRPATGLQALEVRAPARRHLRAQAGLGRARARRARRSGAGSRWPRSPSSTRWRPRSTCSRRTPAGWRRAGKAERGRRGAPRRRAGQATVKQVDRSPSRGRWLAGPVLRRRRSSWRRPIRADEAGAARARRPRPSTTARTRWRCRARRSSSEDGKHRSSTAADGGERLRAGRGHARPGGLGRVVVESGLAPGRRGRAARPDTARRAAPRRAGRARRQGGGGGGGGGVMIIR